MKQAKLDPRAPARNGYVHRQQFGVVVICRDEKHQQAVYDKLLKQRLRLRVVAV